MMKIGFEDLADDPDCSLQPIRILILHCPQISHSVGLEIGLDDYPRVAH